MSLVSGNGFSVNDIVIDSSSNKKMDLFELLLKTESTMFEVKSKSN